MTFKQRTLADLCQMTIETIDPKRVPDREFWYIDISAVDNTQKKITAPQRVKSKDASVRARQVIHINDVIVATTRPNLNAVALVPQRYDSEVCSTGFCVLRAGKELDPSYLFCYVQSRSFIEPLVDLTKGALYPAVTDKQVLVQSIPWVPVEKQRHIAARLKAQLAEVETARQAAQVQLREINVALNRAIESQIFQAISSSDETVKLGEVSKITAKLVQPEQDDFANLPHVSAENIESLTGRLLNIRSAKENGMTSGKYLFDAGDILYSKLRPYLRKVARPDFDGLCSADMYPIKTNESVLSMDFLKLLLTSNFFTDYANEKSARSRMPKLNREQLFDFEFSLPTLEKQEQCVALIGSFLALSEQASEAAKRILKDIDMLPKKILAQAFEV